MSNISNNSQANQVQNVDNTTYDINDNNNPMSRRSYARVVTHDGRWVSMHIQAENNKSSNHINNVNILKGAKQEESVTLYVQNLVWTENDNYDTMKKKV